MGGLGGDRLSRRGKLPPLITPRRRAFDKTREQSRCVLGRLAMAADRCALGTDARGQSGLPLPARRSLTELCVDRRTVVIR